MVYGLVGCVFDHNKIGRYVACGDGYTYILKNDRSVWSYGGNTFGQLGIGSSGGSSGCSQVNNNVRQIACGNYHTMILKNDGSLWACGSNTYGQLGLGDANHRSTFTQVTTNINNDVKQVYCGGDHTYILKNDGSVWACGDNSSGQLGLGTTTTKIKNTFTQVTTNISDVKQIACGDSHIIILKNDGSLWSCGNDGYGQLGLGGTANRSIFTQVTTNINNDVKQIACGSINTIILKNDGSLWGCGYNGYGQLGIGNITTRSSFYKITTNINNDVKQVVCGGESTFILKNDGSIWACGNNSKGQLGLGHNASKSTFTQVTANINNDVIQIDCGDDYSTLVKIDGSVLGAGYINSTSSYTFSYITSL